MPLRGFLICPVFGRMLTGSSSKGYQKHYSYYHCVRGCKCRFRTDLVNSEFGTELEKYVALPKLEEEYNAILFRASNDNNHNHDGERRALMTEMKAMEERVSYARDLMLSKQLDPADFKQIKADCAQQLERLDTKLADLPDEPVNTELLLKNAITDLHN
jgi:site-specific DNA recombinase